MTGPIKVLLFALLGLALIGIALSLYLYLRLHPLQSGAGKNRTANEPKNVQEQVVSSLQDDQCGTFKKVVKSFQDIKASTEGGKTVFLATIKGAVVSAEELNGTTTLKIISENGTTNYTVDIPKGSGTKVTKSGNSVQLSAIKQGDSVEVLAKCLPDKPANQDLEYSQITIK